MVNKKDVYHIAKLARLRIEEKEAENYKKEFTSILGYFELMKELDVSRVEPTFHPAEIFFGEKMGTMREDKSIAEQEEAKDLIRGAFPGKKGKHVKVKTVFDNES
jgi:aspartyl-tRNA(Asn)/glutamyl-tRNA(Gln) amidotransferase subunit C